MACSLSASLDPSRLAGRLSSQARYWSWRSINAATAAAQRWGRGGVRRAGGAGKAQFSRRSRARRRAWGSAGVIARPPMRGLGLFSLHRNGDCHVCQLKLGSSVGPGARRAAAVKVGRSTAQAIAEGAHEAVSGQPGVGWVMRAIAVVTTTFGLPDAADGDSASTSGSGLSKRCRGPSATAPHCGREVCG